MPQIHSTASPTDSHLFMPLEWLTRILLRRATLLLTGAQAEFSRWPEARPSVYFANHCSHADFVLVWAALPKLVRDLTRPVAGADYWNGDPIRRYIGQKVVRAVLIERDPDARSEDPIAQMAQVLSGGESLILFPEGTRNLSEAPLLPLKSGLFHLAKHCPAVPLIPVWIDNLHRVLPKGEFIPVPLLCKLRFGAALGVGASETKGEFLSRAGQALLALRPRRGITAANELSAKI